MLAFRHSDGSNQLGDLTASGTPYADYTGYEPKNLPSTVPVSDLSTVLDPNSWQPLTYFNGTKIVTPTFVGAQFYKVTPFAMTSPDEFLPLMSLHGPAFYGSAEYMQQAQELVDLSAHLTDKQKMIAEYWANGPHSELPPGHWDLFAQYVSARDHHSLDDDVKMFFALTNAIFDAGIAAWDAKRFFDSVRPVTAIPFLFHGQQIQCWGGPGLGTITTDGAHWIPYQPPTFPTPPFPEYISGHSTFSAAGARILALWTGDEYFGGSVTFAAGSSTFEQGFRQKARSRCAGEHSTPPPTRLVFPVAMATFISNSPYGQNHRRPGRAKCRKESATYSKAENNRTASAVASPTPIARGGWPPRAPAWRSEACRATLQTWCPIQSPTLA